MLLANADAWQVYGYCMLRAAWQEKTVLVGKQAVTLRPGQLAFSFRQAVHDLKSSLQRVRAAFAFLESLGILTHSATHRFTIVSITNISSYNKMKENTQHSNNTQPNTLHNTVTTHNPTHCTTQQTEAIFTINSKTFDKTETPEQHTKQHTANTQPNTLHNTQPNTKLRSIDIIDLKDLNNPPTPFSGGSSDEAEKPSRKSKAKAAREELRAVFESSSQNPDLLRALDDFAAMRDKLKKPLTRRAAELLLQKLETLADQDDRRKIKILEQSIMNSWQGVFELRQEDEQALETWRQKTLEQIVEEAKRKRMAQKCSMKPQQS